jgi:hypothetical protein
MEVAKMNNNNKMSRNDKEAIFNKYRENKKKTDVDIMKNEGIKCRFGNEIIIVKALEWDDATEFEKEVQNIFKKAGELQEFASKRTFNVEQVSNVMLTLLNDDLQKLGEKATGGLITLEYIREKHATKKDVINIIMKAIDENFGAVKNLFAQRPL